MLKHKLKKFIPSLQKTSPIGSIFQSFKETGCIKKQDFKINLENNNQVDRNVYEREKQLSETYPITDHTFDVVIVGAGSAGLMCASQLAKEGYQVACISKTIPAESQSALTTGGICAALDENDDWKYHAYNIIINGDFLGDQNAIQYMCKEAPHVVSQKLANEMGMPFTKTEEGKIYQKHGGTAKFGKGGLVRRNCMAEGETGRHLIETVYQNAIKNNVKFFFGFFGMDLLMDNSSCRGVMSYNMNDSTLHRFKSHYTVLATGGYGRAYLTSACSPNCTGDGTAMISRAGLQNQDMEFVQFHNTGIFKDGWIIESNLKGETGIVINGEGNLEYGLSSLPFNSLGRYISKEIHEGRGCGPKKEYLELSFSHLGEKIYERIPHIAEQVYNRIGIDISKDPIPVLPTAYSTLGGVPINYSSGQVICRRDGLEDEPVSGLLAAGEVSNVSVHGGSAMMGNLLTDAVVFGNSCAENIKKHLKKETKHEPLPIHAGLKSIEELDKIVKACKNIPHGDCVSVEQLREEMQNIMQHYASCYRTDQILKTGVELIKESYGNLPLVYLKDRSQIPQMFELQNLLINSVQTLIAAENRKDSRGCHLYEDDPDNIVENRDSVYERLKHSCTSMNTETGVVEIYYKPVCLESLDEEEMPSILLPKVY